MNADEHRIQKNNDSLEEKMKRLYGKIIPWSLVGYIIFIAIFLIATIVIPTKFNTGIFYLLGSLFVGITTLQVIVLTHLFPKSKLPNITKF